MGKERISRAELARRIGCSRAYITKLVRLGKITVGQDGKVNTDKALSNIKKFGEPDRAHLKKTNTGKAAVNGIRRPAVRPPTQDDDLGDDLDGESGIGNEALLAIRIKSGRAKAALLELELKEKTGALVSAEEVRRVSFKTHRTLRDLLLKLPDRVSALIAAEQKEHKIHVLLSQEIRDILEGTLNDAGDIVRGTKSGVRV